MDARQPSSRRAMKRPAIIIGAAAVGIMALIVYLNTRVPAGITPMDGEPSTIAWISLAIAILSLATAVVGLIQRLVELRAARRD
jgi:hypothetical protein